VKWITALYFFLTINASKLITLHVPRSINLLSTGFLLVNSPLFPLRQLQINTVKSLRFIYERNVSYIRIRKTTETLVTAMFCLHADIDECSNNTGGCDQMCNNTEGSFQCHCHKGFCLSDDNITCQGQYFTLLTSYGFVSLIHHTKGHY